MVIMTSKVYTVTDLGPGDGGKGGVVHKVCKMMCPHTVIKVGGAQGSHGVRTSAGERFAFSQWGCGTFEGIRTHISQRMVVSPEGLLNEAEALKFQCGVHNAFDLLTVDERALCATPFHGIASRLKEMARGANPRGTIGTGIGEAYRDMQRHPGLVIRASDLSQPDLKDRLAAVRAQVRKDLEPVAGGEFLPSDHYAAAEEASLLENDGFLKYVVERFGEASRRTKIVGPDFLGREILAKDGVAVVESSHGVLTDSLHGFYPHTSALRTLPCFTHVMLREAGYTGQIVNLGVTRAYAIRHGAGPMPTENPEMAESLLPGSNKQENRYQGKVRVGPMDFVLLRYAINVCGGPTAFDGLAITWFDQIQTNRAWQICNSYHHPLDWTFFSPQGEINVTGGTDYEKLLHQEILGKQLQNCSPEIETRKVSGADREQLFSFCAEVVHARLGVPVRMVSFGPTERDKICK
jgi:adenylosuccinate synthase